MDLYGVRWTKKDLLARLGRLEQVAGVRRLRLAEGLEDGTEQVEVRTGAGLRYLVTPSRGMDIGAAAFGGVPLAWQAPAGEAHPAFYDDRGLGFLRTAAGGLVMTCGYTYMGAPGADGEAELGLHGRAHHTPARMVAAEGVWEDGDDYRMRVRGVVEEAGLFLDALRCTREISSRLGENTIRIVDTVENFGAAPAPHMMLYHMNFGFPLMGPETTLSVRAGRVRPRDADYGPEGWERFQEPEPGYAERVYYHEDLETTDGRAEAVIRSPAFPSAAGGATPLAVRISWNAAALPMLVQWKMPAAGAYVLGVEPATNPVAGRAAAREAGTLRTLEPGASVRYEIEIAVEAG